MDHKTSATSLFRQTRPERRLRRVPPGLQSRAPRPAVGRHADHSHAHDSHPEDETPTDPHRFRAIFISDTHLGTPAARRRAARVPALHRVGLPVPRRRHHRRLAAEAPLVLAPAAQRRRAEGAAQGAQGHAGRLRARQPRRGRAALRRRRFRRHRHPPRGDARHARGLAPARHARRPLRRRGDLREVAGAAGRPALHGHP